MVSLGGSADERNSYWGFTPKEMPLNARVWYPDGPGPFPLVLVVHGNHNMRDFSDPGYDYLGDSRLVDVAVQRLRRKVEDDPAAPVLIETVRGVGYRAGR